MIKPEKKTQKTQLLKYLIISKWHIGYLKSDFNSYNFELIIEVQTYSTTERRPNSLQYRLMNTHTFWMKQGLTMRALQIGKTTHSWTIWGARLKSSHCSRWAYTEKENKKIMNYNKNTVILFTERGI